MGSVKYQLEGSKLTIETGITPNGSLTRVPTSDYSAQFVDEKNNLIRIEIYGLAKVARMEKPFTFGEWGEDIAASLWGENKNSKPAKNKKSGKK